MTRLIFIAIGFVFLGLLGFNLSISGDAGSNGSGTDNQATEKSREAQLKAQVENLAIYDPIKSHYPELHKRTMQQVSQNGYLGESAMPKVTQAIQWDLARIIRYHLEPEAEKVWAEAFLQQLRDAKRQGNCNAVLFKKKYKDNATPNEIRALLTQNTQQRSADALSFVLQNQVSHEVHYQIDALTEFRKVTKHLKEEFGADFSLMDDRDQVAEDKQERQCELMIAIFVTVLSQPEQKRTPILNWLLGWYTQDDNVNVF